MKYLLLALVLLGCSPKPPKFHYNDKVHVYHGFYQGTEGVIQNTYAYTVGDDRQYVLYVNEKTSFIVLEKDLIQ